MDAGWILATVVGCGLTLLVGFAGQVSLGHAAFYAIGTYTAALLARDLHVPPLLALAAAPLSGGVAGLVVGWPLLRLRGHALSFGTLAFQLISLSALSKAKDITGGDIGLVGIPALGAGPLAFTGPEKSLGFAYLSWTLAALAVACTLERAQRAAG
ncbi:MAG TPA: branched-chain amino acid ABC transporter permease, partial [Chloroflexota bacterium]|nr:branched-chain amino acid ABC transporter permease [Chloroflexota bacterium]